MSGLMQIGVMSRITQTMQEISIYCIYTIYAPYFCIHRYRDILSHSEKYYSAILQLLNSWSRTTPKMKGWEVTRALSQKYFKLAFSSATAGSTTIPTSKTIHIGTCICRKGKLRKSSVRRGSRKTRVDRKEQKVLHLLGIEPNSGVHHLLLRSIYGPYIVHIRWIQSINDDYGPYTVNTVHIWSAKNRMLPYGYG